MSNCKCHDSVKGEKTSYYAKCDACKFNKIKSLQEENERLNSLIRNDCVKQVSREKELTEALKEIRESYYPGGADLISDIATEVLEKWRKGNG